MNVYISGGAKNGKSAFAQKTAKKLAEESGTPMYYVATMIARDAEDDARVARHRREREGWGFETLEIPSHILSVRDAADPNSADPNSADRRAADPRGTFLLDSVTALLQNEMFREDGTFDPGAGERVAEELEELVSGPGNWVMVSDYIFSDPGPFGEYTEIYRESLALIDRRMAKVCDAVCELAAGVVTFHKGEI